MSKTTLDNLPDELDKILGDFLHSSFETRQKAVQAGAEVFKDAIENATPKDTGKMAQSWKIKTKYKNRRYVGNTRTVSGKGKDGRVRDGIPLSNVLEYDKSGKHYGFVRQTFDATKSQVFDAIKNTIKNGGN